VKTILVIDLEATCWLPGEKGNQDTEIIEIGAAYLHMMQNKYRVERIASIFVQPRYATISEFCTQLTGITQRKLDSEGVTFESAMDRLKKWATPDRKWPVSWASFGDFDRILMAGQCRGFDVTNPLSPTHFNIKTLHSLMEGCKDVGLKKAMESFKLEFEGRQHSGLDDAVNAARLLGELVKRYRLGNVS